MRIERLTVGLSYGCYSNFKGKVDATADQRQKPYLEVWWVIADSLGTTGRRGGNCFHVRNPKTETKD